MICTEILLLSNSTLFKVHPVLKRCYWSVVSSLYVLANIHLSEGSFSWLMYLQTVDMLLLIFLEFSFSLLPLFVLYLPVHTHGPIVSKKFMVV